MPYSITSGYQVIRDTLGNEKVDAFGEKRHSILQYRISKSAYKTDFECDVFERNMRDLGLALNSDE